VRSFALYFPATAAAAARVTSACTRHASRQGREGRGGENTPKRKTVSTDEETKVKKARQAKLRWNEPPGLADVAARRKEWPRALNLLAQTAAHAAKEEHIGSWLQPYGSSRDVPSAEKGAKGGSHPCIVFFEKLATELDSAQQNPGNQFNIDGLTL